MRLEVNLPRPVIIASLDLLRAGGKHFVRVRSADGAEGVAMTNGRVVDLHPILRNRIFPYFLGQDARQLELLVDGVYAANTNYKLAGLALWNPVGWVEFALLDLLGKLTEQSVGQLLGGVLRTDVPIYLSSMRRDTTPQQEVDWLARRRDETGANAFKIKVGGRMSANADASPGRSEQLVALARRTFGDSAVIYADANSSYDAVHAIEVGRMLQDYGVAFFEEPCPWEDQRATRTVAEALALPVAGGEQESSLWRFRDLIDDRAVSIVQPDVNYTGGLLRTIRVAEMAAAAGLVVTPHSPQHDANEAYLLHFVSRTANVGPYHEYAAAPTRDTPWWTPALAVRDGRIAAPTGPGLGLAYDPAVMARAETW